MMYQRGRRGGCVQRIVTVICIYYTQRELYSNDRRPFRYIDEKHSRSGFTAQSASLDRMIIFAVAASDDGAIRASAAAVM